MNKKKNLVWGHFEFIINSLLIYGIVKPVYGSILPVKYFTLDK